MKLLRKILYWLLLLILFGVAVRWVAPGWIDHAYQNAVAARPELPMARCTKGWAHRGLVDPAASIAENTVASVHNAFTAGAAGVEVDILYDRESGRFVVSHDRPYQVDQHGERLELPQLLREVGQLGYVWLDAKDLRELPPWVAREAVTRLTQVLREEKMQQRVFVESRNPWYLSWLAQKGIHTSLMISPNEHKYSPLVFRANLYLAKLAYSWGPFSALSMNDYRYTTGVAEGLGDAVPVLVSTVNERAAFERYAAIEQVAVVLTDVDHFDVNGCGGRLR